MSSPLVFLFSLLNLGVFLAVWFRTDIRRAYVRIAGGSAIMPSAVGIIEFKRGGSGLPVLVIHGSGGGFDQGELIATAILDERFEWVAPSRFGYLGSTFRQGATFDDQAKAYAFLLDHLGLKKVAVLETNMESRSLRRRLTVAHDQVENRPQVADLQLRPVQLNNC